MAPTAPITKPNSTAALMRIPALVCQKAIQVAIATTRQNTMEAVKYWSSSVKGLRAVHVNISHAQAKVTASMDRTEN